MGSIKFERRDNRCLHVDAFDRLATLDRQHPGRPGMGLMLPRDEQPPRRRLDRCNQFLAGNPSGAHAQQKRSKRFAIIAV
jgi:hypothetical protein